MFECPHVRLGPVYSLLADSEEARVLFLNRLVYQKLYLLKIGICLFGSTLAAIFFTIFGVIFSTVLGHVEIARFYAFASLSLTALWLALILICLSLARRANQATANYDQYVAQLQAIYRKVVEWHDPR